MHKLIEGKDQMEAQRIIASATGVTARQSTEVLMVQNSEVRKALRFIRENAIRPIRVTDVVNVVGLSHRKLNTLFHKELDCSVGTQLTRARIDCISHLLLDTEMKIWEIAETVGYDDDRHFSRYFKRATGLTPQSYRRKYVVP